MPMPHLGGRSGIRCDCGWHAVSELLTVTQEEGGLNPEGDGCGVMHI